MRTATGQRRSTVWRSRWAAVGAAVAVTLGASGLFVANAASSAPSSFVSIEPTRILDTRFDVGRPGPFVSGVAQKLKVTGVVPTKPPTGPAVSQLVVPTGATAVVLNVTVVRPGSGGFMSIRPGDATGVPATSSVNFGSGGPNIANGVTVALPTSGSAAGSIDIYVSGVTGEILIDVAGFFQAGGAPPNVVVKKTANSYDPSTKKVTDPKSISSSSPAASLGDGTEIISLDLPSPDGGTDWLIIAKFNARATGTASPSPLSCTIETFISGAHVDRSIVDVFPGEVDNVGLVGTFTTPGSGFGPTVNVPLVCDPGSESFDLTNVTMTATQVSIP